MCLEELVEAPVEFCTVIRVVVDIVLEREDMVSSDYVVFDVMVEGFVTVIALAVRAVHGSGEVLLVLVDSGDYVDTVPSLGLHDGDGWFPVSIVDHTVGVNELIVDELFRHFFCGVRVDSVHWFSLIVVFLVGEYYVLSDGGIRYHGR